MPSLMEPSVPGAARPEKGPSLVFTLSAAPQGSLQLSPRPWSRLGQVSYGINFLSKLFLRFWSLTFFLEILK